jgi:hypothetical protein
MHKKDSNFLLYENHSIMNTKIISYNWTMVSPEEEQEEEIRIRLPPVSRDTRASNSSCNNNNNNNNDDDEDFRVS